VVKRKSLLKASWKIQGERASYAYPVGKGLKVRIFHCPVKIVEIPRKCKNFKK